MDVPVDNKQLPVGAPLCPSHAKSHGVHYTPSELARFLARHTLQFMDMTVHRTVLDPACGDGSLLVAVAESAGENLHNLTLIGIDRDASALRTAQNRLKRFQPRALELRHADFLEAAPGLTSPQLDLFSGHGRLTGPEMYDAVITNPPYVRTQILGSENSRRLARDFKLSGRVDLFHAFVSMVTERLMEGGVLGLLCSNRFMATEAGLALRTIFRKRYRLAELYDLGDTKLFRAAVLPAVLIAIRSAGGNGTSPACPFWRVYEARNGVKQDAARERLSILDAIEQADEGRVRVGSKSYVVEVGTLARDADMALPWVLTSPERTRWLDTVKRHTVRTFGELTPIRVGIKTTADSVFIRSDWKTFPDVSRPEEELLRPLITHEVARKWLADSKTCSPSVLYPHTIYAARRVPVDLQRFPKAKAYLESHRERLESRTYVTQSGRSWFEIWVPQDPTGWSAPKIVFPDISEEPRFFLDRTGAVVNGDCYWMPLTNVDKDTAYLVLAVANSSFATRFYDSVCTNRLYSGRRRYMSQYVARFPLPDVNTSASKAICAAVGRLLTEPGPADEFRLRVEKEVDDLVWTSFGFPEEASR